MSRRIGWTRLCWRTSWRRRGTQGAASNDENSAAVGTKRTDREGLGRSSGGLSSKIHLLAGTKCRPLARVTTPGQRRDSKAFAAVMKDLRIGGAKRIRPRTRPDRVLADKAYSSKHIREHLRRRGIKATIPQPSGQVGHRAAKGSKGGRPPAFDPESYKQRNVVERAINKLRATRAVATRYDKREYIYPTSPQSRSGFATPSKLIHGTRLSLASTSKS